MLARPLTTEFTFQLVFPQFRFIQVAIQSPQSPQSQVHPYRFLLSLLTFSLALFACTGVLALDADAGEGEKKHLPSEAQPSAQRTTQSVQTSYPAKPSVLVKQANPVAEANPQDSTEANTVDQVPTQPPFANSGLKKEPVFTAATLLRWLVSLLFVLALIYAAAWYLRRLPAFGPKPEQSMRVVSALSVGTRERVVLVQVGERRLLLGVAPGRVSFIRDIDGQGVDAETVTLAERSSNPVDGSDGGTGVSADRRADAAFSKTLASLRTQHDPSQI